MSRIVQSAVAAEPCQPNVCHIPRFSRSILRGKQVCPPGCQALIDSLYVDCDGVTLPDGLFYDPPDIIDGEWSDHVRVSRF